MNRRLVFAALLILLAAATMPTRPYEARSATPMPCQPAVPAEFAASTERTFDQLMGDATSVMHRGMHGAPHTGEPDHDFVAMMIPHHQGAIDMAKALLLYGKDEPLKRLAQEIIADQQNEVQWMQLWLSRHPGGGDPASAMHK